MKRLPAATKIGLAGKREKMEKKREKSGKERRKKKEERGKKKRVEKSGREEKDGIDGIHELRVRHGLSFKITSRAHKARLEARISPAVDHHSLVFTLLSQTPRIIRIYFWVIL